MFKKNKKYSHFLACSAISLMIAFSKIGESQSSSNLDDVMPFFAANSSNSFGFGTTKATTNCLWESPYTQIFSIMEQVFNSDSTFPKEIYSPACNLTKSFFLSVI